MKGMSVTCSTRRFPIASDLAGRTDLGVLRQVTGFSPHLVGASTGLHRSNQTRQDRPGVFLETQAGLRRNPLRASLPGWRSHKWREDTDPELTEEIGRLTPSRSDAAGFPSYPDGLPVASTRCERPAAYSSGCWGWSW